MKNTNKIYEWVPKSRGDELPSNAIYSGSTHTDGHVYVGRFNNIPGKVNLSNKKIYNFWVQAIGSQKCGEVLVTNNIYKWVDIVRGDKIPDNAVYSGTDQNGDKVWVGRSVSGESGKINCNDNSSNLPLMHNLWYNKNSSDTKAHILIIQENKKITIDKNETDEEVKIKNNKLEYLHSNKTPDDELPLWKHCVVNTLSKTTKTKNLEVSAEMLAKNMFEILSSVSGNIISLANLVSKFKVQLSSGSTKTNNQKKEFIVSNPDSGGICKYAILLFSKEESTKKHAVCCCNYSVNYTDIKVYYTILEPINNSAQLKCQKLINEKTSMIFESFRPRRT